MTPNIAAAAELLAQEANELVLLTRSAERARELAGAPPDALTPQEWADHHAAAGFLVARIADTLTQAKVRDIVSRTRALIAATQVAA